MRQGAGVQITRAAHMNTAIGGRAGRRRRRTTSLVLDENTGSVRAGTSSGRGRPLVTVCAWARPRAVRTSSGPSRPLLGRR